APERLADGTGGCSRRGGVSGSDGPVPPSGAANGGRNAVESLPPAAGDSFRPGGRRERGTEWGGVPTFTLTHVTRRRPQPGADGKARPVPVLHDVSAEIPGRTLCLLMGPSGSGKSTLLRLLNRLDDP